MRVFCPLIAIAIYAFGQSSSTIPASIVLDDLEQRALSALQQIQKPDTPAEIQEQFAKVRGRLEHSLRLDMHDDQKPTSGWLYVPLAPTAPAPAVIVVDPHEDPRSPDSDVFATNLTKLGFVVLSLDLRADHANFSLIANGATPEGLMQRYVRTALAYLRQQPLVDPKRIGIFGMGLMTTIAAAINPEFSASVVVEGAPNLKDEISRMRTLHGKDVTDSCALVPGLVQYAGAEQLLSLIAPRPVLVVNPSKTVIDYVSQVFRVVGSEEKVYSIETNDALERRYAAYRWFGKCLRPRSDAYGFSEGDASATPARLQFADTLPTRETPKKPVNGSTLAEFLGRDLPEPKIPIVLQIALKQRIILQPHPGRRSSSLGCPPRADFEPFGNHLGATAVYRAV